MTTSRSDEARIIRIAAAVVIDARGRTLLVRKRGTQAFMQAGGKLDDGEGALQALAREVREELDCEIAHDSRHLGCFRATAANEADCIVEAQLFAVELIGDASPTGEIEEAVWLDPFGERDLPLTPLRRDHVLPLVRARGGARA